MPDDTTPLRWPRESTFRDTYAGHEYPGEGVYPVPDSEVAHYLRRGWERVEDPDEVELQDPRGTAMPGRDEPTRDQLNGGDEESPNNAPGDGGQPSDSDSFDPGSFVDAGYQDLIARIEAGDADGHLGAVRDAETNDRDRKTVKEAIDERMN